MSVSDLHSYRHNKIKQIRAEENRLMVEARRLIDESMEEGEYDFTKLAKALELTDQAVELHKELKKLEQKTS